MPISIQKLAVKYAQVSINDQFRMQRARLAHFCGEFRQAFQAVLNEMEGDIVSLKEMGFDRSYLKIFAEIFHTLTELNKNTTEQNVYVMVHQLDNYVNDKTTYSNIEVLSRLISQFIQERDLEDAPGKQLRVESLVKLMMMKKISLQYVKDNPMISLPKPEPLPASVAPLPFEGNDEVTKV